MINFDKFPFINGKIQLRIISKNSEQLLNTIWKREIKSHRCYKRESL